MNALAPLSRFVRGQPGPVPTAVERCEMCAQPREPQHRHVVDTDNQTLFCVCAACGLLFEGLGPEARYRTTGRRVLIDPTWQIEPATWTRLQIPVRLAFFAWQRSSGRWLATYPGVAGPTRAEPDESGWAPLSESRLVRALDPGVEALLVSGQGPVGPLRAFGAPVDRCFALVALLRQNSREPSSSARVWDTVTAFLAELRTSAITLPAPEESPP